MAKVSPLLAGLLALVALASIQLPTAAAQDLDVAVLNFALNLEYLEAQFYSCAAYGRPLDAADIGDGPDMRVIGCEKAKLSKDAQQYAMEIANDEIAHVKFIRAALTSFGQTPAPSPVIDISEELWKALGDTAGLVSFNKSLIKPFNPYKDDISFFLGAFVFEDVGVTAYKGAARLLTNKDVLEAAAGILAVEAYHSGAVRSKLIAKAMAERCLGVGAADLALAISNLRDFADGEGDLDQPLYSGMNYNIVPTDANGIAYSRDTCQVLKIVYLGNTDQGGFFPDGLTGAITSC